MKVIGIGTVVSLLVAVGVYFFIGNSSTKTNNLVGHSGTVNPLLRETLDVNHLTLLAVSVQDQKAVLSLGGADTVVVSKGESIGSKALESGALKLLQVSNHKIVLKSNTNEEMYFVYLTGTGDSTNRGSLVQKLSAVFEDQQTEKQVNTAISVLD